LARERPAPNSYEARLTDPRTRQPVTVRLAPFFRVHHQRYALYWKSMTPQAFEAHAAALAANQPQADSFIGKPDREQAAQFQGENSNSGSVQGRQFVTIRFQGSHGFQAGGLFGIRLLPVPQAGE
jgi:hypothetical protein